MCELQLLVLYDKNLVRPAHVFRRVSGLSALPLVFPTPSPRHSALLLLLELGEAPFPYLLERQKCVPQLINSEVNYIPLRDLHQT